MQIKTIFLDVDEVLAQWVAATIKLLGASPDEVYSRWDALAPRPWDLCEAIPCNSWQMWDAIHSRGAAFWEEIEPFPWAHDLYERCAAVAPVVLLTSPSRDPSSFSGKSAWIRYHFPGCDFLIGSCKHRVAHPGAVLIDDSPKNCEAFREAGGHAILFPGVGNDLHGVPGSDRARWVENALRGIARAPQAIVESTLPRTDLNAVFAAAFGNNELTPEQTAEAWGRATPAARAQWLRDEIDVVALYRSGDA